MKKMIAMIMALAMVLALAACGGNTSSTPDASATDTPVAVAESAVEILEKVWATYGEDEKFFAMGGDFTTPVDGAPGAMNIEDADSINSLIHMSGDTLAMVDDVASLLHAMNQNTFTAACYHVTDKANVQAVVDAMKASISGTQWMCGFPDQLVIAVVGGDYVVSVFGSMDIVPGFVEKLQAQYEGTVVSVDESLI